MKFNYYLVDSFTDVAGKGNPAGVVFHDGALTDPDMRAIAGNLERETAFLHREDETYRIQFYTSEARVPLCGHDTIAAGVVLTERGEFMPGDRITLKSDIGDLPIEFDGESVWMTQMPPEFGAIVEPHAIATLFDIAEDAVESDPPPRIVSTGTPFLFARLSNADVIQSLTPDFDHMMGYLRGLDRHVMGVYVWAHMAEVPDSFHGRCFAPVAGLLEDPVTGSASGALVCYFVSSASGIGIRYKAKIEQGSMNGRNGFAFVDVAWEDGQVGRPRVGGSGVITESGAGV